LAVGNGSEQHNVSDTIAAPRHSPVEHAHRRRHPVPSHVRLLGQGSSGRTLRVSGLAHPTLSQARVHTISVPQPSIFTALRMRRQQYVTRLTSSGHGDQYVQTREQRANSIGNARFEQGTQLSDSVVRVSRLTRPTVALATQAKDTHITTKTMCFHGPLPFPRTNVRGSDPARGGCLPPNIPGKLTPPLDPCPPASEGGVHCYHGSENGHFSATAELFFTGSTFSWFCQFSMVRAGVFTISTRPNVPVARFLRFRPTCTFPPVLAILPGFAVPTGDFTVSRRPNVHVPRILRFPRFPRLTRFRPFRLFCQFMLFRLVISQYPGDRTCTFHVFSVFPDLHVFARFGYFAIFSCSDW